MFPLNDTEPNRYGSPPFMTIAIICANALVMIYEWIVLFGNPREFVQLINLYGSVPQLILNQQGSGALSSITSAFMHAGLWHLVTNMWALWVFGRRLEDACGAWRFLGFYLTCGVCADILSTLVRASSTIPGIGASGAIFGLMGAYLVMFPGGRIRTLIIFWFVPTWPKLRAFLVIFYYLALQLLPALNVLSGSADYQVNYWAHLGGFFGCFFIFLFLRPEAFTRYLNDIPV